MQDRRGPSGFLLGLVIGGAVGALVSTKKGRQILKDLANYGVDYIGNTISMDDIESMLNNEEEEMMSGEMDAAEKSEMPKAVVSTPVQKEPEKQEDTSRRKRIFRGIKKK